MRNQNQKLSSVVQLLDIYHVKSLNLKCQNAKLRTNHDKTERIYKDSLNKEFDLIMCF